MLKVNSDPSCPGVGIAPDDASLDSWDIKHKDRGKFGYSHIDRQQWEKIFGQAKPSETQLRDRREAELRCDGNE